MCLQEWDWDMTHNFFSKGHKKKESETLTLLSLSMDWCLCMTVLNLAARC